MKDLLIVILFALLAWFGSAVIRLERYHHANQIGLCPDYSADPSIVLARDRCFDETETRTGPLWHLAYGLGML